jgi:hypothetical protein
LFSCGLVLLRREVHSSMCMFGPPSRTSRMGVDGHTIFNVSIDIDGSQCSADANEPVCSPHDRGHSGIGVASSWGRMLSHDAWRS